MKKFLFVVEVLTHGGAERVVANLANELTQMGNEVSIIVYYRTKNEYETDQRIKIYALNTNIPIVRKIQRPYLIRQYAKRFNPNYIIPFLPLQVVETYIGCSKLGVPIIGTVRNNPDFDSNLIGKLYLHTLRNIEKIYCQTETQKNLLPKKLQGKSFILPNPVTPSILKSFDNRVYNSKMINFVTVGRIDKQKNHLMLIRAFHVVHSKFPETRLQIYGDGNNFSDIQSYINKIYANQYISLMGRTENVEKALLTNDVFLFSSNYEGMPNALMEAMATGMPCISTDCPTGPRELIGNNERGLLVPVNDIEMFAEMMIYLIENPNKAVSFGVKAHEFIVKNYSLNTIASQLIEHII